MGGGLMWSNGGPLAIIHRIEVKEDDLNEDAAVIVKETVDEAKEEQIKLLRAAVTETGLSGRPAGRNGPGRDNTGHMIDMIVADSDSAGNLHYGSWGWEESEYFADQDDGTERIPAANSLYNSFISAREKFIRRVTRAGRTF